MVAPECPAESTASALPSRTSSTALYIVESLRLSASVAASDIAITSEASSNSTLST